MGTRDVAACGEHWYIIMSAVYFVFSGVGYDLRLNSSSEKDLKTRVAIFDDLAKQFLAPHFEEAIGMKLKFKDKSSASKKKIKKNRNHDERSYVLWNIAHKLVIFSPIISSSPHPHFALFPGL